MYDSVFNLIEHDSTALMRLLREVYNKGLDDGAEVARRLAEEECPDLVPYDSMNDVFHNWEMVEELAEKPMYSVEDFVDTLFTYRTL